MFKTLTKKMMRMNHQTDKFSKINLLRNSTTLGLKEYQKIVNQIIESVSDQAEEIIEDSVKKKKNFIN